jgi:succinate dehydrogenase flavin-adding protein (antitoxin of CptAB toxin-antitoxin module)
MLELDLLLARFWERHGGEIGAPEAVVLEDLLDFEDNDLLELILGEAGSPGAATARVLRMLRES